MNRLRALALTLGTFATSLGCHPGGNSGAAGPSPTREPAEPAAPTEPTTPHEPASFVIGWAEIPGELDAVAGQHHREGVTQLRTAHYEAALASFDQALAIAPEDPWSRFDRARALARLGRADEAVAELERLVLEDLPTFGPRWAVDEDLAAARAAAAGRRLDARLPVIREAYRRAIGSGVPAMTYRARAPRDAKGQPQVPHEGLRLGVYEPTARRFVPAVPAVPGALAGYLDRQADRALVLAGELVMGEIWLVQARRVDVSIFDLDDPGRMVLHADDVDVRHPETHQIRVAVEAAVEGDDARVTLQQLLYDPKGTMSLRVTANGIDLTREHVAATSPRVHVDANGAFVDVPPPAGLSLEGQLLRVHARRQPIELGPGHDPQGHPTVARTIDDRWAVVLTEVAGCKEVAYTSHVLDRVDLERREATRLSAAATHASVALGADGSVFLDADDRVVRFPPGSSTAVADVMPGVRFVLPDYDRDCSI
jgi:tetratricopeptide (TPR) repeat protein